MKNVKIEFRAEAYRVFTNVKDITFFSVGTEGLIKVQTEHLEYVYPIAIIKAIVAEDIEE